MYNIFTDYERPMPGEGPFYTDYLWKAQAEREVGLEYIDWKESKYTYLAPHKEDIIEIFNLQYKYRELGQETESRFQDTLQQRFNEIADKYNHAFKVTEENDVDKLGTGYTYNELRNRIIKTTGSSTATDNRDSKYKDTPSNTNSTLNNPTNQNIDERESSNEAESEEELHDEITRDNVKHDKEMIVELSELIDKYRQLEIEFVYQFEQCFMGLMSYGD